MVPRVEAGDKGKGAEGRSVPGRGLGRTPWDGLKTIPIPRDRLREARFRISPEWAYQIAKAIVLRKLASGFEALDLPKVAAPSPGSPAKAARAPNPIVLSVGTVGPSALFRDEDDDALSLSPQARSSASMLSWHQIFPKRVSTSM